MCVCYTIVYLHFLSGVYCLGGNRVLCRNILKVFELDPSKYINCFKIKINLTKIMLILKDFSFFMIFHLIIHHWILVLVGYENKNVHCL